jgi:hypothetical protein
MGAALLMLSAPGVVSQLSESLMSPLRIAVAEDITVLRIVPPLSLVTIVSSSPAALGVRVIFTPLRPKELCCAVLAREMIWSRIMTRLNALPLISLDAATPLRIASKTMTITISIMLNARCVEGFPIM